MTGPGVTRRPWGTWTDGRAVDLFTLDNGRGLTLSAMSPGGTVTGLQAPDRWGRPGPVVLALPTLADYAGPHPHIGTLVGRYANRIAHGRFPLDGAVVQLPANDGPHTLHGGPDGFGRRWWDIEPVPAANGSVALQLRLTSPDGDQGFPGRLDVTVTYTLTAQQAWRIDYRATCDRPTVVNLSHHAYFNLAGGGDVLDHQLQIDAGSYCPVDAGLIPRGLAPVDGTPFDFRRPRAIGQHIRADHEQLQHAGGYDHNWVLEHPLSEGLRFAARLAHPASGRILEVLTDQPGLQFYSGNFLDGSLRGRDGQTLQQHHGLCLETQHFPDAPNQPRFASTVLRPGDVFTSTTVYRFGVTPSHPNTSSTA